MNLKTIKLSEIVTNPNQPRKHFDEQALLELAESIKADGLQEAILVRPKGGTFEIVQGERRYRAHKMAGLETIEAKVKKVDDEDAFHLAVIENIQREQLSPIEEAQAFARYVEMGYTHEEIAKKVSKGRTYVTERLRMLNLLPELQDWIAEKRISQGHTVQLFKYEGVLSKHIGRNDPSNAVQSLFYQYFENSPKISVNDVKAWGELMRWHFLAAIIGTFNGKGKLCVWNKYRNLKSFCGDYHLHIKTVTREDIHFMTEWAIKNAEKGTKKSIIYEMYENLEEFLFDSGTDIFKIWDSRKVENLGERTLDEITKSIREHLRKVEEARAGIVSTYREGAEQSGGEEKIQLNTLADRIEKMDIQDFIDEYLFKENVSRETIEN